MLRTVLCIGLLAPALQGCVAVAAAGIVGVGLVQYERNEAQQDFATDLQVTWKATLEGLLRLKIEPAESLLTATEGRIEHDGMVVLVERHPEGFTRVRVRVNTFHSADNQRRARLVLQEIEASLASQDELKAWVEKVDAEAQQGSEPGAAKPDAPKP